MVNFKDDWNGAAYAIGKNRIELHDVPGNIHATYGAAFQVVLGQTIKAAKDLADDGFLSPGGIPRKKTSARRRRDWERLNALLLVLSNAFAWDTGEGNTIYAIEVVVRRLAGIESPAASGT